MIKKKVYQQLPEEKQALLQFTKYIQKLLSLEEGFEKIEKYIKLKTVFINQIATRFYEMTKENQTHKQLVQILYLIDHLCKNMDEGFREAIKDYIRKIYIRVYQNVKSQSIDTTALKIILKSWFNIFPLQILLEITTQIRKRFHDDLNQLTEQQYNDLSRYYRERGCKGFQDYLLGKAKLAEPPKIDIPKTIQETQIPNKKLKVDNPEEVKVSYQQQIPIAVTNFTQYRLPSAVPAPPFPTEQFKMQQHQQQQWIVQQLRTQANASDLLQMNFQASKQQQIQPQAPPIQAPIATRNLELSQESIFGCLFKYFNEQSLGMNKSGARDFLKKQMKSSELLFNPNKFSTLMKCPTCLMRFRNETVYIKHLKGHAMRKLTHSDESAISNTIEQWLTNPVIENTLKASRLHLTSLKNDTCWICLEKFWGQWDSVQCEWFYDDVVTIKLISDQLDEPQVMSVHSQCFETLNQ